MLGEERRSRREETVSRLYREGWAPGDFDVVFELLDAEIVWTAIEGAPDAGTYPAMPASIRSATTIEAMPGNGPRTDRRPTQTGVTVEEVRSFAMSLPRTTEALVRDRVKFRVGRIVYVAFSRDETVMGFAFPKEEREALVESEPDKFMMPSRSDLRFKWVLVRLASIDAIEMRELVLDAWRMVVPKKLAAAYDDFDPAEDVEDS